MKNVWRKTRNSTLINVVHKQMISLLWMSLKSQMNILWMD